MYMYIVDFLSNTNIGITTMSRSRTGWHDPWGMDGRLAISRCRPMSLFNIASLH